MNNVGVQSLPHPFRAIAPEAGVALGLGLTNECNLTCSFCYRDPTRADRLSLASDRPVTQRFTSARELFGPFDDKHGLIVDQDLVAVMAELVILLDRVFQQRIADISSGLSVVFVHNRFELVAHVWIAAVVHSIGVKHKNVSRTHQRDLRDVGGAELFLPEAQGVIFLAVRMVRRDLQSERKELHHAALIDVHELAIFR